jgi:hypothetical protein
MKAKHIHGAAQTAQTAARDTARTVLFERSRDYLKIACQFGRIDIRRDLACVRLAAGRLGFGCINTVRLSEGINRDSYINHDKNRQ